MHTTICLMLFSSRSSTVLSTLHEGDNVPLDSIASNFLVQSVIMQLQRLNA